MTAPDRALDGRRALVVGGSTGVGRGIADAWARAGAAVTVASRSEPSGPGADRLAWARLDLTEPGAGPRLGELAAGGLDAVCFSSVFYGDRRAPFGEVTEQDWHTHLDVNVTGLWHTLAATLGPLRDGDGGLFVGVSSEVAFNSGPGRSSYAATKAAAKALLDSVAHEEGGADTTRVRIVQVLPAGMVDSPGIRRRRPADFDFSGYMGAEAFGPVARELATTGGAKHHGETLVVDGDGSWWPARDGMPVSQSRPVRS